MNSSRWIAGLASLAACGGAAQTETARSPTVLETESEAETSGGGGTLTEVHRRGQGKLVVAVGPAGGTLELDNGARLVIPKGAIAQNTEVTLATGARTSAFSNHDYERAIGPIVEVVVESGVQSPVEVSIPLGTLPEGFEEKDLTVGVEVPASSQRYESAATQTRWDYVAASSRAGRAVAQIEPPGYRVQFLVSKND
jgi:hypothetical protein